jgi:hypothetical protein
MLCGTKERKLLNFAIFQTWLDGNPAFFNVQRLSHRVGSDNRLPQL